MSVCNWWAGLSHKRLASFRDPEFVTIKAHFVESAEGDFA